VLDFVGRAVVPVGDGEDAEVFVVVERGWAVDLDSFRRRRLPVRLNLLIRSLVRRLTGAPEFSFSHPYLVEMRRMEPEE
jgi:hypothetical protein